MFNKDVFPFLAKKRVSDITETDIRFILKKIMKDRGTNRIAVRIHKDIIQLFKWAEERQPWRKLLIEGNPAKVVDIRSIILSEYEDIYGISDRLLSDEEILELHNIYIKIITGQINDRQVMFKNYQEDAKSKRNCNNSLVLANGENGDWTPHDLRRTGATLMQNLKLTR